jgi:hypothetical protein
MPRIDILIEIVHSGLLDLYRLDVVFLYLFDKLDNVFHLGLVLAVFQRTSFFGRGIVNCLPMPEQSQTPNCPWAH